MKHYFTNNIDLESDEKNIYYIIRDKKFHFITDNGVFSKSGLDFGSRLLIETTLDIEAQEVLDLGCGYGPIGLTYKYFNPSAKVTLIDINERATFLSEKNADLNNLEVNIINKDITDGLEDKFSLILSNPPIRSGKSKLFNIIETAKTILDDNGSFYFVIHKKLGAASALRFCEEIYKKARVINRKSGYLIIKCTK